MSSSSGVGTGFFIAPNGWILTCDHVVLQSNSIQVSWLSEEGKQEFTAEVKVRLSEPFDIALLKVKQEIPNHKCVYLDNALPQTGDNLYAFGYPQEYGNTYSGGESITAEYEGQSFQDERLVALKFRAGQILEGCSGSPLLNLRTGKVCGIIKSSFDSGGRAAPCSLLFQVEKLTNLKSHREIIRALVQRNKKFHQKDDKTWNKIVKQLYWDRKLALILTIISLVCFAIVWQSEIEDRLFLAMLRLVISSGFGYAAILFFRSTKVFSGADNYFIINSLIGFFTTLSVFLASFLLIVDHAIITRNLTGINFYPTLGLIEDRIPSPLKKVLSINEEPIVDKDNSVYDAVKAFRDESGNRKLSFLSDSRTGLTSAFNKNDRTVRAIRPGDIEEKDINITERINQTRKDFESEPTIFESEHQDFYYSSIKMPLQISEKDSAWTFISPLSEDANNKRNFGMGSIIQYPALSTIKKLGNFSNSTESKTVSNLWINNIIDSNPNLRGFLEFSYAYMLDPITSLEGFDGKFDNPCYAGWSQKDAPSPYIRFVNIKNNSFSSINIQSVRKKLISKDKYKVTSIPSERDNLFQEIPSKEYPVSISIPPGSHFFIPTEFGFDTRRLKSNNATINEDKLKKGINTFSKTNTNQDFFIGNLNIDWRLVNRKTDSLEELLKKTIHKVIIPNDFIINSQKKADLSSKIPNRFAVGSISNLVSVRINGKDIQVDNPLNDSRFSMSAYFAYGSCPYLLVYDSEKGYWIDLGNIMVRRQDEKSKDYETFNLGNHPSKFRIEEREQEVTYLNSMSILYTDSQTKQEQKIQSFIPELSHLDDKYIVLKQNENLEINLEKILPKNAINVRVQVNGYYKVNPGVNLRVNQRH